MSVLGDLKKIGSLEDHMEEDKLDIYPQSYKARQTETQLKWSFRDNSVKEPGRKILIPK